MWDYLSLIGILILCLNTMYWFLIRPARRQARLEVLKAAELPKPEPREPADLSRPYPRPEGRDVKLNRVCPICGTGRETGDLDGRLLGWRAHRTCAEWLGEWKPTVMAGSTRLPLPPRSICVSGNLSGIVSTGDGAVSVQSGRTNTTFHGGTAITVSGTGGGGASSSITNLMPISAGIPPMKPASPGPLPQPKKPPAPVYQEWCTCGLMFTGTSEQIGVLLHDHKVFGMCPHSVRGRQADPRIAQGITATGGMERQRLLAAALRAAGVPLPVLTHAKMVGRVDRVGVSGPAIWYVVCSCGVTVNGALEEMASRTQAHMGMCASRIA